MEWLMPGYTPAPLQCVPYLFKWQLETQFKFSASSRKCGQSTHNPRGAAPIRYDISCFYSRRLGNILFGDQKQMGLASDTTFILHFLLPIKKPQEGKKKLFSSQEQLGLPRSLAHIQGSLGSHTLVSWAPWRSDEHTEAACPQTHQQLYLRFNT